MPEVALPILFAAVAVTIAVLSLLPDDARVMTLMSSRTHRAGHLLAYAVLTFTATLALPPGFDAALVRALVAFLVASAFGIVMEFLQKFRPGRAPSRRDALVNAAGAALGSVLALAWLIKSA